MTRRPPEPVHLIRHRRDRALSALVEGVPYIGFMGIGFDRRGDELTAVLTYDDKLIGNPMLPAIHGGVTASFLEVSAIMELSFQMLWDEIESGRLDVEALTPETLPRLPKTIDFTVDYLRSGLPRDAYARARVNRSGRRYASVHVEAWQDNRQRLFRAGHRALPDAGARRDGRVISAAEEVAGAGPLTHRRVLKIALPVVISNATVPLLGIVDTAVVGQLGDPAPIGAVGLGAVILTSVYWAFGFLRMGTVGLAAQAIGARDRAEGRGPSDPRLDDRGGGGGGADPAAGPDPRRRTLAFAGLGRGRGTGAKLPHDPNLLGAGGHRALRDHRLVDRAGADGRGAGAATGAERAEHRAFGVSGAGPRFRRSGCRVGDLRGGMGGAGAGSVVVSRGLRRAGLARLGPRLRRGQALAHGGGERRYPDPVAAADGGLRVVPLFRGRFRGRDARGQPGADPVRLHHRPCDGRFRLRGRGAGGPGHGRARGAEAQARGAADQHLGADRGRRHVRSVPRGGGGSSST